MPLGGGGGMMAHHFANGILEIDIACECKGLDDAR